MQSRRVGMKIQSDGTQTLLLLFFGGLGVGFFPFFFLVLSLAGPNSFSPASAEAAQNLWSTASPQLQRRANPCGMRDHIPREQLRDLQPRGPALVPLGAVSPSETHPLQGVSTPAVGNTG